MAPRKGLTEIDDVKTKDDEFLRVKEAAKLLGIAPNTLRQWGATQKIPEYRHPANNFRLYKRSELEELVAEIEKSRTGPPGKPR